MHIITARARMSKLAAKRITSSAQKIPGLFSVCAVAVAEAPRAVAEAAAEASGAVAEAAAEASGAVAEAAAEAEPVVAFFLFFAETFGTLRNMATTSAKRSARAFLSPLLSPPLRRRFLRGETRLPSVTTTSSLAGSTSILWYRGGA